MTTKVWITKYALSQGVIVCPLVKMDGKMCTVRWPGGLNGYAYFHGQDWHLSQDAAQARFTEMKYAKVLSLSKQVAKIEALRYKEKG